MIPTLYRGSVKDLLGPVKVESQTNASAVVFEYTDAFSVFDWGRMPDFLPRKGEALATLAADFFERLEQPESWKEFSKTPEALALRKANKFGAVFNELGEDLQSKGLRTHYLGVLDSVAQTKGQPEKIGGVHPQPSSSVRDPFRRLVVKQVSVAKPKLASVLGRVLPDYFPTRSSPPPRLVPLEVIFRMSCPEGSSLLERIGKDPGYLASLGFPDLQVHTGAQWNFPILELFTKLESTDRPVSLSEALAISGLTADQLQHLLLKTAWVAGLLRYWCSRAGVVLADGKLEWGVSETGESFLVDAIGPDELRILKDGVQLSKEFLRSFYRSTPWYQALEKAKAQARSQGVSEWKRFVIEAPPMLPTRYRELGTQVYLALTNELSGRKWFTDAWSLSQVTRELHSLKEGRTS